MRGAEPRYAPSDSGAAAALASEHLDDRHVERLVMIVIAFADEDRKLFTPSREHRSLPSRHGRHP